MHSLTVKKFYIVYAVLVNIKIFIYTIIPAPHQRSVPSTNGLRPNVLMTKWMATNCTCEETAGDEMFLQQNVGNERGTHFQCEHCSGWRKAG